MTLLDTVVNGAKTAFTVIDSFLKSVTYTSKGVESYDATSGAVSSSDTEYTSVKLLFEEYSTKEIDDDKILRTDRKGSLPQADLVPVPKQDDFVTVDGEIWFILDISTDAADAVWNFQLRKK